MITYLTNTDREQFRNTGLSQAFFSETVKDGIILYNEDLVHQNMLYPLEFQRFPRFVKIHRYTSREPSTLLTLKLWIQSFQFNASIISRKLPVNALLHAVSFGFPFRLFYA